MKYRRKVGLSGVSQTPQAAADLRRIHTPAPTFSRMRCHACVPQRSQPPARRHLADAHPCPTRIYLKQKNNDFTAPGESLNLCELHRHYVPLIFTNERILNERDRPCIVFVRFSGDLSEAHHTFDARDSHAIQTGDIKRQNLQILRSAWRHISRRRYESRRFTFRHSMSCASGHQWSPQSTQRLRVGLRECCFTTERPVKRNTATFRSPIVAST